MLRSGHDEKNKHFLFLSVFICVHLWTIAFKALTVCSVSVSDSGGIQIINKPAHASHEQAC